MKNIAIINLVGLSSYFYEEINGSTQLSRIKEYSYNLPDVEKIIFISDKHIEGLSNLIVKELWNEEIFMTTLNENSKGFDHIFYYFGDCPLLDSGLSEQMFQDHINFYAEYSFADGYPYGLTPEILDTAILPALQMLSNKSITPLKRDSVFNIVKKDINSFELETKIAENDLRLLRVSLTTDSKRNYNQLKRIISLGAVDAESVSKILINNPEILLQEPSYITIELTKKQLQSVTYLPARSITKDFMEIRDLKIILDKIKNYSDDCIISFTPEYEPTTHPELLQVIKEITDKNFTLFIETSGLGWDEKLVKEIIDNKRVKIIVTLDAVNPELYREIRGDGQAEAVSFTKNIVESIQDRIWIQATRMKTNEIDMEPFYRYWQQFTSQIIIQKYSNYNQTLPDLKVADLSPLKRFPCWHLKKELHITTEGEVVLCFNDINHESKLGSLVKDEIEVIIDRKKVYYQNHLKGEYSEFCRKCDEYYTFNF